jgi:hypothetical protein
MLLPILHPLAYGLVGIVLLINTALSQTQPYTLVNATYITADTNSAVTTKQVAQQNIAIFLNLYQQNHTQKRYTFEALVHFKNNTTEERKWLILKEATADGFTGYLSDVYDNSLDLSSESFFYFKKRQIEDWRIINNQLNTTLGDFGLEASLLKSFREREDMALAYLTVPSSLQELIPQAIMWGIEDDFLRLEQQKRATSEQKKQLLKMVKEKESIIENWLADYANSDSYSIEKSSFYYLMVSFTEIGSSTN